MKNFILSFLVCFPALLFAQNGTQCNLPGDPPQGGCCYDCTCRDCGSVAACENNVGPLGDYANCLSGGCGNCETGSPTTECESWTENYYLGADEGCIPIDGGLGFLIAGGLGMGVLGVRRRKELELEA
ncbi:hypothetical protein N9C70_01960 [Flavobacteriales bacterium]|nr:hypothetical protein [Flavobacteriales bacterium]